MSSTRTAGRATRGISQRALLTIAFVIAILEGYDLACYGVTVPSLLADPELGFTPALAGTVGSLTAFGMLVGGIVAGSLTHRIGPRALIVWSSVGFTIGMILCGVALSAALFGVGRFLVGFGLGIVLPTLLAYVGDLSQPARRAGNVGLTMGGYALGGLSAPLLAAALLPEFSFRWIYVIGAIPAIIITPIAFKMLPESPSHLMRVGRHEEAQQLVMVMNLPVPEVSNPKATKSAVGLGPLFSRGLAPTTILFWLVSFCGLLLVFGISTWLPTIMQEAGFDLGSALLQTAAMWIGAGVGAVAGGKLADIVGPKRIVVTAFLIGAVSLVGMSLSPNVVLLFLLMFVSGFGFIGSQILVNAFIVTRYPDDLRGNGLSWALAVGRPGAMLGPLLGAWVLTSGLPMQWNFYVFAIVGVVGAIVALLVPKPKQLEPRAEEAAPAAAAPTR